MTKALKEYAGTSNSNFQKLIADINEYYAPNGWRVVNITENNGFYFRAILERDKKERNI